LQPGQSYAFPCGSLDELGTTRSAPRFHPSRVHDGKDKRKGNKMRNAACPHPANTGWQGTGRPRPISQAPNPVDPVQELLSGSAKMQNYQTKPIRRCGVVVAREVGHDMGYAEGICVRNRIHQLSESDSCRKLLISRPQILSILSKYSVQVGKMENYQTNPNRRRGVAGGRRSDRIRLNQTKSN
jgi:hypothetical protein